MNKLLAHQAQVDRPGNDTKMTCQTGTNNPHTRLKWVNQEMKENDLSNLHNAGEQHNIQWTPCTCAIKHNQEKSKLNKDIIPL